MEIIILIKMIYILLKNHYSHLKQSQGEQVDLFEKILSKKLWIKICYKCK